MLLLCFPFKIITRTSLIKLMVFDSDYIRFENLNGWIRHYWKRLETKCRNTLLSYNRQAYFSECKLWPSDVHRVLNSCLKVLACHNLKYCSCFLSMYSLDLSAISLTDFGTNLGKFYQNEANRALYKLSTVFKSGFAEWDLGLKIFFILSKLNFRKPDSICFICSCVNSLSGS